MSDVHAMNVQMGGRNGIPSFSRDGIDDNDADKEVCAIIKSELFGHTDALSKTC